MNGLKVRASVAALEQVLRAQTPEQIAAFVESIRTLPPLFADGMYCRRVFRRRGTTIIGKVHKKEHFYIVVKGRVAVTNNGGTATTYEAGDVIKSEAGTKRAVFALEDSLCMTVHRTDNTDLAEIEKELLEPDELAWFDAENVLKFDPLRFRNLTKQVIAGEKPGFWSDWTPEQQGLYSSGDWRAFSQSRDYTEAEIETYADWLSVIERAQKFGINPFASIADLAIEAAAKNIALDTRGEILKSSHAPFESREAA